jgi:HK97 family phage major capsid protein
MNLKALRQRDADLRAAIARASKDRAAIGNAAVSDKRAMTDDERKAFVEAGINLDGLNAQLAENAELLAAAEAANEAERNWRGDTTDPDADAAAKAAKAAGLRVGRDLAESDPMRGFKTPREFMSAVMEAGLTRGRMDSRLKPLQIGATQGSDEQGTYSEPYGGFFVPVGLSPTVMQLSPEDDPISPLVTQVPLTAPTVKFNARVDKDHTTSVSGGFTVSRHPETVDGTSSRAQYEQVTLTADELFGVAFATERLLTDSPTSFAAVIAAGFRDQFSDHLIEERFNGTGIGEFLGFMKSASLLTVAKETGQAADTIVTQNIDKMVARCWRYGSAVWHANHTAFPQLQGLTRAIGTGGSIVNYLSWAPGGQMQLLGRPLHLTEHCAALGDLGDLALCNWSEFLEGTYQPMQSAESIHVRFLAHERTFKLWLRNGGSVWWKSVLTPKHGDTRSPFVTLAAR